MPAMPPSTAVPAARLSAITYCPDPPAENVGLWSNWDKRVMIFRADENGTLQDCTDGHWVQPNCLDIREGVLSPDFYSTPGDDMKAAMENARRRREEIMKRDGLLREDETLDIGLDQQDPNAQNEHLIAAMQKIMHQLYHGKMPRHEDDSDVSSIDDDSTARR
mmetsp:Transcript_2197/g.4491  ORF Transcript_2197/g.4491 Transcript_2197/m.4491 type:complete len:163 (+) Transcript_2197:87-575(+)